MLLGMGLGEGIVGFGMMGFGEVVTDVVGEGGGRFDWRGCRFEMSARGGRGSVEQEV